MGAPTHVIEYTGGLAVTVPAGSLHRHASGGTAGNWRFLVRGFKSLRQPQVRGGCAEASVGSSTPTQIAETSLGRSPSAGSRQKRPTGFPPMLCCVPQEW